MLKKFKQILKQNNNKNFTFVKIKSTHSCYRCSNVLGVGTECLTVNPKRGSRRWYCDDCVQLMLNVQQARVVRQSVAFGDEGAEMTFMEWEDEVLAELEEVRSYYS